MHAALIYGTTASQRSPHSGPVESRNVTILRALRIEVPQREEADSNSEQRSDLPALKELPYRCAAGLKRPAAPDGRPKVEQNRVDAGCARYWYLNRRKKTARTTMMRNQKTSCSCSICWRIAGRQRRRGPVSLAEVPLALVRGSVLLTGSSKAKPHRLPHALVFLVAAKDGVSEYVSRSASRPCTEKKLTATGGDRPNCLP